MSRPTTRTPRGAVPPRGEVHGRLRWLEGNNFEFVPDAGGEATGRALVAPVYADGHVRVTSERLTFHEVVPRLAPVRQPVVERPTLAVEVKTTRRYIAKTTKVMRSEIFADTTWEALWGIMHSYDQEAERAMLTRQRRAQSVREEVQRHGL